MHNIDYDYVRMVMREREAALRQAQLSGMAYQTRPRRTFSWPWAKRPQQTATGSTRVARAS